MGYKDKLYIVPTLADNLKFFNQLTKWDGQETRGFKKNSKIGKAWVKSLKDNDIQIHSKPFVGFEFECAGKFSTRLFEWENILYCSIRCESMSNKTPEDFREILGSEFYKIMEESEEHENGKHG